MVEGSWKSGEVCEVVGKYCARCCTGVVTKRFVIGDIFHRCHRCDKKLKWVRTVADTLSVKTTGKAQPV